MWRKGVNFYPVTRRERDAAERETCPDDITLTPGLDGSTIKIKCWTCDNWGHSLYNYPNKDGRNGSSSIQFGMILVRKMALGYQIHGYYLIHAQ